MTGRDDTLEVADRIARQYLNPTVGERAAIVLASEVERLGAELDRKHERP